MHNYATAMNSRAVARQNETVQRKGEPKNCDAVAKQGRDSIAMRKHWFARHIAAVANEEGGTLC